MACKNVRSSYNQYKKTTNNEIVDSKTYIDYANEFNRFLAEKVIEGYEITLPSRLGTLSIIGKKQKIRFDEDGNIKGLAPDWVKTKKLWEDNPEAKAKKQLLYHTNSHTDNTIYKFLWSKNRILITNKILYSLKMTRTNKRAVNELVTKMNKKYVTKFI